MSVLAKTPKIAFTPKGRIFVIRGSKDSEQSTPLTDVHELINKQGKFYNV